MVSPDFQKNPIYKFIVFDDSKNLVHTGMLNSKAWSKSIETKDVWEYIPDNGRVISKEFPPLIIDFSNIKIIDDCIYFQLFDRSSEPVIKNKIENDESILLELEKVILKRKAEMPQNSYTTHLFEKGEEKILKKLGEEAIELILTSKGNNQNEIIYETADLIYHMLVYLSYKDIPFKSVLNELKKRMDK
jgi:phosphoribosyl-ATP pyrophosphohydrolase